jgi:hypothetical protein
MLDNDRVYTTQELIDILHKERIACVKGERAHILPPNADEIAIAMGGEMARVLGASGMCDIAVYHEFREQVQQYQQQHQISGLETKTVVFDDCIHTFPENCDQLVMLPSDLEILKLNKDRVVDLFERYYRSPSRVCYLAYVEYMKDQTEFEIETTIDFIKYMSSNCDYAFMHIDRHDDAWRYAQATLIVGRGDPNDMDTVFFYAQSACGTPTYKPQADVSDLSEYRNRKQGDS